MPTVTFETSRLWLDGNERSLLAYLMTESSACEEFLHRLLPEIFVIPVHRKILGAIHDVYDEREKVNHLSVSNRLREKANWIHAAVLRV